MRQETEQEIRDATESYLNALKSPQGTLGRAATVLHRLVQLQTLLQRALSEDNEDA